VKSSTAAFLSGTLFAIGLGVSGMTDANKVIGFLNAAGSWDPSLAFVMVGAIGAHLGTFKWVTCRDNPLCEDAFSIPTRTNIDKRLVFGAGLFGVGWGLGGFCPGPGIVSCITGSGAAVTFVGTLLLGMFLYQVLNAALSKRLTGGGLGS